MIATNAVGRALAGVMQLSVGTVLVRGLSAVAQFVLAIWLHPAEFGYWAAAVSATGVGVALTNFGMVDGYLSRRGLTYARLRRETLLGNSLLMLTCLVVAGLYALAGSTIVAGLVVLAAVNIPLMGLSDVLLARQLREHNYRTIVGSQALGALAKLVLGIVLAILTGSAVAIAVGPICFSIAMVTLLQWRSRGIPHEEAAQDDASAERFTWAVNALASKLPLFLGFFVAQFLTSPAVLGLYYLSYQAVVATSSMIAPPLRRVVLNTLANSEDKQRTSIARAVSSVTASGTVTVGATVILVLPMLQVYIPEESEWRLAIPALLVFIAALPTRMLSPVTDAYQQANNRWWKSTRFHAVDGLTICLASIAAVADDVLLIAIAITLVRTLTMAVRLYFAYPIPWQARLGVSGPVTLFSLGLLLAGTIAPDDVWLAPFCLLGGMVWLCIAGWRLTRTARTDRQGAGPDFTKEGH